MSSSWKCLWCVLGKISEINSLAITWHVRSFHQGKLCVIAGNTQSDEGICVPNEAK